MPANIDAERIIGKFDKLANADYGQALRKACLVVENDAKRRCPVADGQLRASIRTEINGNVGTVGTNVEYAPYVEIGTGIWAGTEPANGAENYHGEYTGSGRQTRWSYQDAEGNWYSTIGQQPQPFLFPALFENTETITQVFKDEIVKELEK